MTYLISNQFTKFCKYLINPIIIIIQFIIIGILIMSEFLNPINLIMGILVIIFSIFFLIYPLAVSRIVKYQADKKTILVGKNSIEIPINDIEDIDKFRVAFFRIKVRDINKPIIFIGDFKLYMKYNSRMGIMDLFEF